MNVNKQFEESQQDDSEDCCNESRNHFVEGGSETSGEVFRQNNEGKRRNGQMKINEERAEREGVGKKLMKKRRECGLDLVNGRLLKRRSEIGV